MTTFEAVMLCEGAEEAENELQLIDAWQLLIDTNIVWELQGFFGRKARRLINAGICSIKQGEI